MARCCGLLVLLLAAAAVGVAAPRAGLAVTSNACTITQNHSLEGTVRTDIRFVNRTAGVVKVYWLDYSGRRVYYDTIAPGASVVQPTWKTHPWVVLDASGACIGYVVAPRGRVRDRRHDERRGAGREEADVHRRRLHDRRRRGQLDVHGAGRRRDPGALEPAHRDGRRSRRRGAPSARAARWRARRARRESRAARCRTSRRRTWSRASRRRSAPSTRATRPSTRRRAARATRRPRS